MKTARFALLSTLLFLSVQAQDTGTPWSNSGATVNVPTTWGESPPYILEDDAEIRINNDLTIFGTTITYGRDVEITSNANGPTILFDRVNFVPSDDESSLKITFEGNTDALTITECNIDLGALGGDNFFSASDPGAVNLCSANDVNVLDTVFKADVGFDYDGQRNLFSSGDYEGVIVYVYGCAGDVTFRNVEVQAGLTDDSGLPGLCDSDITSETMCDLCEGNSNVVCNQETWQENELSFVALGLERKNGGTVSLDGFSSTAPGGVYLEFDSGFASINDTQVNALTVENFDALTLLDVHVESLADFAGRRDFTLQAPASVGSEGLTLSGEGCGSLKLRGELAGFFIDTSVPWFQDDEEDDEGFFHTDDLESPLEDISFVNTDYREDRGNDCIPAEFVLIFFAIFGAIVGTALFCGICACIFFSVVAGGSSSSSRFAGQGVGQAAPPPPGSRFAAAAAGMNQSPYGAPPPPGSYGGAPYGGGYAGASSLPPPASAPADFVENGEEDIDAPPPYSAKPIDDPYGNEPTYSDDRGTGKDDTDTKYMFQL